jgi:oxygen-independent coproporphyrinogen-3 oxidase
MKALGVNRVSVCAQALDDKLLGAIGRKHTNAQSMRLIEDCLAVGIENIHLDLMYGLPGQTTSLWEDTLVRAAGLPITHASAYKLYIFKYGALHRNNVIPRPESESEGATTILEDMYNLAHSVFADSRLCQYSLTEFARAGYRSKYIMGCFDGSDLLPIGPSAFGRANREIWDNSPYVHMYGTPDSALHDRALVLSPGEAFKRDLILGLWLLRASVGRLANRYEVTASCELLETLEQMKRDDLIAMENGEVILEQRHRFAAGVVMGRLADLELSEWIAGDATRGNIAERPNATWVFAGAAPTSDLAAVLRMARRDPEFFFGLDQDTTAALAVLERELGPDELDDLRQAILGTGEPSSSGLAQAWRTIRSEHVREPRTRQGDSSESRVFDAG